MLILVFGTRDYSGHSGQRRKYDGSRVPTWVSRLSPTRDMNSGHLQERQTGPVPSVPTCPVFYGPEAAI